MLMKILTRDSAKEDVAAQAHIWNQTLSHITTMSLRCAVQLGIPDIIYNNDKPVTLSELVKALSIPETKSTNVFRLMRVLVHAGFFDVQKIHELKREEGYVSTPTSKLLSNNHDINLSSFLLLNTDPFCITPFHFMSSWLQGKGSRTPFEAAHGMDFWSFCSQHSDANKIFDAAMSADSEFVMNVVFKECKPMFEGFSSLVDVGGGTGSCAKAISEAFPHLRCTVLDLPHVVSHMQGSENVEFVGGDMFEYIPSADIILLKWIMHDWTDEECVEILKRCKEAIPSANNSGKVIIIDIVVDVNKGKNEAIESQLCSDILMMVLVSGKERTETEWEKLFLEAGFTSYKITHGFGSKSVIEVFP
ncbi:hypothetical protein IFM89_007840 [Coptis chinensis]|uniref:Uncharacterized protein n=1 Tax=Coptis chinensis TaxID=261450 RepID=A0A835GV72_9MAGN|nr:hypothetical protein IFM89_007840 [Coptis chinensis]